MITKIAAIVLIGLSLSGCATLTVATVGGLVVSGALTGAGRYAGENIAHKVHVWRRCHRLGGNLRVRCYKRYAR